MDINEYISSGILELYVAGALSEKENEEVYENMQKYPAILKEVEQVEEVIRLLSADMAPSDTSNNFMTIYNRIKSAEDEKTNKLAKPTTKTTNYLAYTGWAAAVLLAIGLLSIFTQNQKLKTEIAEVKAEKIALEQQFAEASTQLVNNKDLLSVYRNKDAQTIILQGQEVAPNAYAKVLWDKQDDIAYIDAAGLPEPPKGKVYQVWSLTFDPLTPTSLGTLDGFVENTNKIYTLSNSNASEAFGITLEPAGGSEFPTLEQLYTLGKV